MKNKLVEEHEFLLIQEQFYWNSDFKWNKWYRRALGGRWYLLKLGRDTPPIGMFMTWSKLLEVWSGHVEIYDIEEFPVTGICKWKSVIFFQINFIWRTTKSFVYSILKYEQKGTDN